LALGALAAITAVIAGAAPAGAHVPRHHHRPHPQALTGQIGRAHVRVVDVPVPAGRGGYSDPGDDYPAQLRNPPQDSEVDHWGEYSRECTSFVAWALSSRNGFNMPFHDNANRWGPDAARRGYAVNSTPAVGSVAWSNAGTWGHVAFVVAVGSGTVTIEEYNHYGNGAYDKRTVATSHFTGYIHFADPAAEPVDPPPATTTTPPTSTPPPTTTTPTPTPTTTTTTTTTTTPPPPPTYYVHHVVGTCADGACGLHERTGPGYTSYGSVGVVYDGQEIDIACQTMGETVTGGSRASSAVWDRLSNGSFVSDYYTDTPNVGVFSPPIPPC
jgi:surface antigen